MSAGSSLSTSSDVGAEVGRSQADLLRHSVLYLPSVIIPAAMNFLFVFIFTRLLGPAELGKYFVKIAVVSVTAVALGTWFQQSILRFDSGQRPERVPETRSFYIVFLALSSSLVLVGFATYAVVRNAVGHAPLTFGVVLIPLIIAEIWYRTFLAVLQAEQESKLYSVVSVSLSVGRYGLAVCLFVFGLRTHYSLLYGLLAAEVLTVAWLLERLGYRGTVARAFRTALADRSGYARRLASYASYGIPMLGFMLASEARPLLDRVLITLLDSESAVGVYSSNYTLGTGVVGLFSMPMLLTAHPLLMSMANAPDFSVDRFRRANHSFMRVFLLCAAFLLILFVPNSRLLASLALGHDYVAGFPIIALSLTGSVLGGLAIYVGKGLEVRKKTLLMLFANICSVVLTSAFNYYGIRRWGFIAAGYGYVLGSVTYLLLIYALSRSTLPVSVPWGLIAILAGAVASSVVLGRGFNPSQRWPQAMATTLISLAGLFIVLVLRRDLDRDTWQRLSGVFVRIGHG